ncbi:sensor histidine kinase [Belliella marina]|uniref:Sensor histidine kinase n=1 Tax=Belliella marina TaxID=1644146 RepID=A0ABW4VIT7_9BACT
MIVLFWAFIATILIFQLLAVDEYDLPKAITYSSMITGTFAVYVHVVLRKIIKKYIQTKRISSLIFWVFITAIVASTILTIEDYAIDSFLSHDWNKHKETMLPQFFGMLMATILISGIAYSFELYRHHIETLKATQVLKDSLNELEVKSIRQQLSPHFTFNMLNNLQFLIQKDKNEALKLLSQYSKILRYYVYESQNKAILLNDEIAFLKTYLELEKDRLKDEAKVDVDISIEPNSLKIAPFILSTFVENAFKHLSIDSKWTSVFIHYKENQLCMNVQNTYDNKIDSGKNQQGIGLEQVTKRLQLIYPDKHVLEFDKTDSVFSVQLNIKFD